MGKNIALVAVLLIATATTTLASPLDGVSHPENWTKLSAANRTDIQVFFNDPIDSADSERQTYNMDMIVVRQYSFANGDFLPPPVQDAVKSSVILKCKENKYTMINLARRDRSLWHLLSGYNWTSPHDDEPSYHNRVYIEDDSPVAIKHAWNHFCLWK
jgi:hypothetical protein